MEAGISLPKLPDGSGPSLMMAMMVNWATIVRNAAFRMPIVGRVSAKSGSGSCSAGQVAFKPVAQPLQTQDYWF